MPKTSRTKSGTAKPHSPSKTAQQGQARWQWWTRFWPFSTRSTGREMVSLSYYVLLLMALGLLAWGMVMVFSTHSVSVAAAGGNVYSDFARYAAYGFLGLFAMIAASRIPPRWYHSHFLWVFFLLSLLMQGLVFVPGLGVCVYGNCNWISIAGVGTLQPSEFLKLSLALVLGHTAVAVTDPEHNRRDQVLMLLAIISALGSVMMGGDLGTVIVMALLVAGSWWIAGMPKRWFAILGLVGAFLVTLVTVLSANRRARIEAWLNPDEADVTGIAYQPMHGRWALATGGLTGVGPSGSRQKWGYLTQADSDYIFAVLGEEFGLVGTLAVICFFCAMAYAMFRVMRRHNDLFIAVTTAGIISWIIGQAAINIAVVTGLLPVLGVPLPLMSAGGSSLVSVLAAIGVVLAFARNEPGAREAFSSRMSSVRRSLAVIAPRRRNRD